MLSSSRHRRAAALFLFLSPCMPARAASLAEQKIEQLIRTTPAVQPATLGIEIVQLGTGKVLYDRNANKLFTPASNTKLFSTAFALTRLGPDYRIPTRIFAERAPDPAGRIDGDLIIVGLGDPSMSFQTIPYQKDATLADPMAAVETFADQLLARGVRSISGNIVGDDSAFPFEPFPPGWGVDDPVWDYGAPVSALSLGSNSIKLDLFPGPHAGDPATLAVKPRLEYFLIDNLVRTAPAGNGRIEVTRLASRELRIAGNITAPDTLWLAVDDPALYTAAALYDALTRRGIAVAGRPSARHRSEGGVIPLTGPELAERMSPPLIDLLRVTDKISQNLWAELMLRQVALARTGDGSRKAALEQMKAFLNEIGVTDQDYVFEDGSGLSRMTLVKPDAVVRLLRHMHGSPARAAWVSLLPVGGEDGSLAHRFHNDPAARNIHAKTGSLSHVNALSGYADSATYGEIAFSIIVNHSIAPASDVREFIDRIGMILLE
jgi:D-alanyl-D-alanine carboxypeptidase/D-alanyl-D-alanine-endopeptidase (penicillin-binding protein 4)